MMRKELLLSLLISVLIYTNSSAQNLSFNSLSTTDGLSQSEVKCIVKDKYGYLWMGTSDGLNRYDGYTFEIFRNNPRDSNSVTNNTIQDLQVDALGNIWINTIQGLSVYDIDKNFFFNYKNKSDEPNSISNDDLKRLFLDSDSNMWISTQSGVDRVNFDDYKDGSYNNLKFNHILTNLTAEQMIQAENGDIIIGCWNQIVRIAAEYRNNDTLSNDQITQKFAVGDLDLSQNGAVNLIELDNHSFLMGTTQTGLLHYYPDWIFGQDRGIHYRHDPNNPESISFRYVTCIARDANGTIWLGSQNGLNKAVWMGDSLKFERIYHDRFNPNSLIHNNIYALYSDNNGILWIGTMGGGLSYLDLHKKQFHKHIIPSFDDNRKTDNFIRTLKEGPDGNIWIGTFDLKLIKFNPTTETYTYISSFGPGNEIVGSQVFDIIIPNDKVAFIGTIGREGGLMKLDLSDKSAPVYSMVPRVNAPFALAQQGKHIIWAGGWNSFGRVVLDDNYQTTTTSYNLQPNNPVRGIAVDEENNILYVGTLTTGLVKIFLNENYEPDKIYHYQNGLNNLQTISSSTVRDVIITRDNTIWVGTNNGLNKVLNTDPTDTNLVFQQFFISDGLPSDRIQSIVEDRHGHIWIGTVNGISQYNPKTQTFKNYDVNDGLQNNEFVESSRLITSTGEVYFGGIAGFNRFYPDSIKQNPFEATPTITKLKVNNQEVEIGKEVNGHVILKHALSRTDYLKFRHKDRILTFEISALHYSVPKRNYYKYYLEGFDDDWLEVNSDNRSFTYTNLRKGWYTLHINASNNDKIYPEKGLSIRIRIKPPFWNTIVFYILVLALLAYLSYLMVRERIKQNIETKRILEEKVKEGEAIIAEKMKEVEQQQEELRKVEIREHDTRYINSGLNLLSENINQKRDNLSAYCLPIISSLVKYLEAQQGIIYILEEGLYEDAKLVVKASYACDSETDKRTFLIGEGYPGICLKEKRIIELEDIPQDYSKVESGLGELAPGYLLFSPMILDETLIGVIEISSFEKLESHKLKFIEKVVENITAALVIYIANEKTQMLLQSSQEQEEELKAQEEEMRQNLEEMAATQEDLERQMQRAEEMKLELEKNNALLDAFLNYVPELIYFKDIKNRFLRISKSMLSFFHTSDINDVIGKSDLDFQAREAAEEYMKEEQQIIETGVGIFNKLQHDVSANGEERWLSTTKLPMYDEHGKCLGTFGITRDISDFKELEQKLTERNEELLESEEGMQNTLEELQSIQEDLEKQIKLNKGIEDECNQQKEILRKVIDDLEDEIDDLKSKIKE